MLLLLFIATTSFVKASLPPVIDQDFCKRRKSGHFLPPNLPSHGRCTPNYINCHRSRPVFQQCTSKLSFSPGVGCVPQSANNLCNNNPCRQLSDGNYRHPKGLCRHYQHCFEQWTTIVECSRAGYVWSETEGGCQHRSLVPPPCGYGPYSVTSTATTTTTRATTPLNRVTDATTLRLPQITSEGGPTLIGDYFQCDGRVGNLADPAAECTRRFVFCSLAGIAHYKFCALGTYYDKELKRCHYFFDVPECIRTPRTLSPEPTTAAVITTPATNPLRNDSCSGVGLATYRPAVVCLPFFYQCRLGLYVRVFCPGSLCYDHVDRRCIGVVECLRKFDLIR